MARYVANVDVTSDTFSNWITRTNQLLDSLASEIVTANSTLGETGTTGSQRNARIFGSFAANTVVAETGLRGGTTGLAANLAIVSNAVFSGAAVNVASNATFTANVFLNGANLSIAGTRLDITSNVGINVATIEVTSNAQTYKSNSSITVLSISGNGTTSNATLGGNLATITANLVVSGTSHTLAGNVNFDSGSVFVDATNNRLGLNTTTPDATLAIVGTANVSGNVSLTGTGLHTIAGNVNFDSGTVFVDATNNRLGVNTTTPDASVTVTGTANVSANVRVGGVLTVAGNTTLTGNATLAGTTTFNTDYVVDVSSTADIGTMAAPRLVYRFPKATYKTGKLLIQATNSGTNQIADVMVAHDGTDAYLTVYGVVASPPAAGASNTTAPLGIFTAAVNGANVDINMTQLIDNSAVKVVAHLIK